MPMTINGSGTITGLTAGGLPDASVVQADLAAGVAGNGPAFSAYQSSAQTLSGSTWTKIQFQTEEFDTNNCYDNATNYRFTPNVAGYYQITGVLGTGAGTNSVYVYIYKNGAGYKRQGIVNTAVDNFGFSALVYCNGTTDYIEIYGFFQTGMIMGASYNLTYFQGALARAA